MDKHETPTKLRQGIAFYGIPLTALPWLLGAVVITVVVCVLNGPWVALFVTDRWLAIACRLALALALGGPVALLAAPGVIYGDSLPRFALIVARSVATPRLTLWRAGAPCPAVAHRIHGTAVERGDDWGAEREEWQ